jgi:Arc/MetJ-type ribon-helix-helix transcriptional regulator
VRRSQFWFALYSSSRRPTSWEQLRSGHARSRVSDWRRRSSRCRANRPDQRAFVQKAIESGRFSREEEAVAEALALWEERERRRLEILAMLDEADASLARGEGREITERSMKELAEAVKRRGRLRLASIRSKGSRSERSPRI